jgi:hypothetical protein
MWLIKNIMGLRDIRDIRNIRYIRFIWIQKIFEFIRHIIDIRIIIKGVGDIRSARPGI